MEFVIDYEATFDDGEISSLGADRQRKLDPRDLQRMIFFACDVSASMIECSFISEQFLIDRFNVGKSGGEQYWSDVSGRLMLVMFN